MSTLNIVVKRNNTRFTATEPFAVRREAAGKRDEHGLASFNATRSGAFTSLTSAVAWPRWRTPFGRRSGGHASQTPDRRRVQRR